MGYFDHDRRFHLLAHTPTQLGLHPVSVRSEGYQGFYESDDFSHFSGNAKSGKIAHIRLKHGHANGHVIYVTNGRVHRVKNIEHVLFEIRELIALGQWRLDWGIVSEHVSAADGNVIIFTQKNAEAVFNVDLSSAVDCLDVLAAGVVSGGIEFSHCISGCTAKPLHENESILFDHIYRVRHDHWKKLHGGTCHTDYGWQFRPHDSRLSPGYVRHWDLDDLFVECTDAELFR